MNVILSNYFTSKPDPQRGTVWNSNDLKIIESWYLSIIKLKLNAVIFHDHCSDYFIRQLTTDKISFVYYEPKGDIMNAKFRCFYNHILNSKYSKIFCTDISDVIVMKDPFPLIKDDSLICGSEEKRIGEGAFMREVQRRIFNKISYKDKRLLNCGIIGGYMDVILGVLRKMVISFNKTGDRMNSCMAVFNHVIYNNGIKITTGSEIHSVFGAEETEGNFYFKHK